MDKFVLIDGNSLINRAFYATPPMSNSKGVPTNAVYAFINILLKIIGEEKPKYISVAFDRREPTFRHAIFSDYKGTRKPAPDDLRPQIPLLKEVLDALKISHCELATYEADDIIGTLSKKYPELQTVIITGDKDSFQLVDESSSVYFTKRGITEVEVYTNENFKEKIGIEPIQIIDLKALMGDSSDNIPGVKGVGEKTAKDLIATYQTVENLYSHIDEIKGKLKEKLISGKESASLSKTLATINTRVPIDLTLDDFSYVFPFPTEAKGIFLELELRNVLKKAGVFEEPEVSVKENKISYEKVIIKNNSEITTDIKNNKIAVVIGDYINFYDFNNIEYELYINQNFFDDGFNYDEAVSALKPIFENENNTVIVYYKNQIRHLLEGYGIEIKAKTLDVSIMKYLVDFTVKDDKLSDVFTDHNLDKAFPASSLAVLYEEYSALLRGDEEKLYYEMELPLADVLYDMESAGFKIDLEALNSMGVLYGKKIEELQKEIVELGGVEFNPASPKQLSHVLFEVLNLKHGKKNKNGYSTGAEVLEELENDHPIIPKIMEFRQFSKLKSTYVDGYRNLIDKKTGLVHTTFNQVQTATGRISSREPNLQNIPIREKEGREIRRLFSARDDRHVLIDADYSQIELRLLAHCSGSEKLIDAFNNGVDIHSVTASQVFGVPIEKVTKEMRSNAKAVNFGIIYGISDFGLAKNIRTSVKTAREYITKYFEMYPKIKEYMDGNVAFARKNGYAVTLFGRKRYIREINSANYNLRSYGERVAMNMPLQGAAADIIKIAMINVHRRLVEGGFKSKLILQVHDELVIDALKSEKDEVLNILVHEMENAVALSVPLSVEASVAECWYDAKS